MVISRNSSSSDLKGRIVLVEYLGSADQGRRNFYTKLGAAIDAGAKGIVACRYEKRTITKIRPLRGLVLILPPPPQPINIPV